MKKNCIDCDKIIAKCPDLLSPEPVETCITQLIYRYEPATTPGLNVRLWDNTHGPHLDPLEWTGPLDINGFPLPTSTAPDLITINNSTNINDSNSGLANARYTIIDGWAELPEGTTHIRDNNANTGEYGMVLSSTCCGSILIEQAGGNHAVNTSGVDRTLMDSVPASEGWLYVYSPQSDSGAANGLDLEYSTDGGTTWINVPTKQPNTPVVECQEISSCDPIPEGWQLKPLKECCDATYQSGGGLSEDEVIALIPPPVVVPDQEICTGDFVDVSSRAGWLHTWTPTYNANSGTIVEDYVQVGSAEISPNCVTDITVNVSLGNSYFQLRNMYGRAWYDVRLLINGAAVTTFTFQNYHYEDDLSEANLSDDISPLGSAHFARTNVPAGATITVEIARRHNFVAGNAVIAAPFGRVISGLRAHFNVHYSPIQIVTGRV